MMRESSSLPRTKPEKMAFTLPGAAHDRVGLFLRQRGVDRLAAAGQALLLHAHQIDGHDDAHDQVEGKAHRAADAAPDAAGQRHNGIFWAQGSTLLGQKGHAVGSSAR